MTNTMCVFVFEITDILTISLGRKNEKRVLQSDNLIQNSYYDHTNIFLRAFFCTCKLVFIFISRYYTVNNLKAKEAVAGAST